jgi:hypothetical protein
LEQIKLYQENMLKTPSTITKPLSMYRILYCLLVIGIVSKQKHLQRCTTTHLKANTTPMSGEIKGLQLGLQKLQNYTIQLTLQSYSMVGNTTGSIMFDCDLVTTVTHLQALTCSSIVKHLCMAGISMHI